MLKAELNFIPEQLNSIHLVAVCGTGMGALACILKQIGYRVTGSDANVYPPMSDFLHSKGIKIFEGYRASNLDYRPDLVVVGNAVSKDNPEADALADLGLPYCSMPQAVCHFLSGRKQIMVSGTHGKTTTCSLIAWILFKAGMDPSFFIGGIVKGFDSNFRLSGGKWLVVEGDEYDTAFFDKGPKFLHFNPSMVVLTGVEFDHADIYDNLEQVEKAFDKLVSGIAPGAMILAWDSSPCLAKIIGAARCKVERYGRSPASCWRAVKYGQDRLRLQFSLLYNNGPAGEFNCPLIGWHNLDNVIAAVAVATSLGISREIIAAALESFPGVKRRQEIKGEKNGILIIDDFAHHPTAVKATIEAVAGALPGRRLIAVFEPRTNSSRRKVFQNVYPGSFEAADIVCVRRPPLLERIPAGQRFSAEKLVADLCLRSVEARFFEDTGRIIAFLQKKARPGDVVLVMSNGGFDNIHSRLLAAL